jgi:hypothetical protein
MFSLSTGTGFALLCSPKGNSLFDMDFYNEYLKHHCAKVNKTLTKVIEENEYVEYMSFSLPSKLSCCYDEIFMINIYDDKYLFVRTSGALGS